MPLKFVGFLDGLFWKCEVTSIVEVTHNVKMFCFKLPDSLVMDAPVAHHVHLQRTISGCHFNTYCRQFQLLIQLQTFV